MKIEKFYSIPGNNDVTAKVTIFFTGFVYIEFIGMQCQLRAHADELVCRTLTDVDRQHEAELKCCSKTSSVPLWKLQLFRQDAAELMSLIQWREHTLNYFKQEG
ncbi:hypothetical protein ABK905_09540 [Acerihabitans sp. KWT182]|uniref:Uncharacterized protein n=1 Tax=Acerihabitans sp. KWT182 TaxID=3157919 RepID=A0AAU7QG92_9GAMM